MAGSGQYSEGDVVAVFAAGDGQREPLATNEVAEALDCAPATAEVELERLAERGLLEAKPVGTEDRVWWPSDGDPQERSPEEELAQYRTVVETVPDGVYTLDAGLRFTAVNEGLVELSGYPREALVGAHSSLLFDEPVIDDARDRREYLSAHPDEVLTTQYDLTTASGETVPVEVRFTALEFDQEYRGTAGVIRDLSDRLERQRELQRQRDELDELNRINAVIRDVDQAMVRATTREEVEQAVCDRLADADPYVFAWIAEYGPDYDRITPRAWAGVEAGYFEDVLDGGDDRPLERGPGATALRTRTVRNVQDSQVDAVFSPWREDARRRGYESLASIPLVYNDVEYGVLAVYAGRPGAFDDRETAVLAELGETVSHAIAAIERTERERTLTALQEATRELLHIETPGAISRLIAETAVADLDLAGALVYRFDDTEHRLEPDAVAGRLPQTVEGFPALRPGDDSALWSCYIDDESVLVDDPGYLDVLPADTPMRSAMLTPLGDHGALVAVSTELGAFNRDTRRLVDLVAATAQAAFDRVEGEAELRRRDEALQERNRQLARVNRLNELIREVDQGLVQATTRDGIEQVVCDRLTASDRFRFAWIGSADPVHDRVTPRAWSGDERGYLDSVALETAPDASEPAVATARSGDVTVVPNVATDLRSAAWRSAALSREFQSVISVPLLYSDYRYGVLTVYGAHSELFDEMERSVMAELGRTVANAINAVETKEALLTDSVVELDFELHGETQRFLPRLARQVGCDIDFVGSVPGADGSTRVFFTVDGGAATAVEDALEEAVTVASSRPVAEDEDGCLFEATVDEPTIASTFVEHGASPRTINVVDGTVHVIVELPRSADVRGFIEHVQRTYADAAFVARRDRDRPVQTPRSFRGQLEDVLTDRQREVLETAFYGGYFESPRASTGEEIAEQLDVSSPTVTGHLRAAERRLLSLVFDA